MLAVPKKISYRNKARNVTYVLILFHNAKEWTQVAGKEAGLKPLEERVVAQVALRPWR